MILKGLNSVISSGLQRGENGVAAPASKIGGHQKSEITKIKFIKLLKIYAFCIVSHHRISNRHGGVVVRASASQSVDLGFIPLVQLYQTTLKNGIHSFPAWRSAFMGGCREQAGKFACCVLGQGT